MVGAAYEMLAIKNVKLKRIRILKNIVSVVYTLVYILYSLFSYTIRAFVLVLRTYVFDCVIFRLENRWVSVL